MLVELEAPAPAEEKVSLCPQCERRVGESCQALGVVSHFRRPLALRSPASRLGLPSSVEDVVGSVCPQRAISACSATEAVTASSQPFISSWKEKEVTLSIFEIEDTVWNQTTLSKFQYLIY